MSTGSFSGSDMPVTRWGINNNAAVESTNGTFSPTNNFAGDANAQGALWIPTWSGEVLHAYDQYNMFEGLVDSRTITSGTTVEFPVTGTIALKDAWEAGEELGGGGSSSTKFSIGLDRRPIAAHFELDNIDVMIQQFEFRSELARQAGLTLANERDRQIARLLVKGSQTASRMHVKADGTSANVDAAGFDADYAGTTYYFADGAGSADTLDAVNDDEQGALAILSAIEAELVKYRELDIPEAGLTVAVDAKMFNQIRRLGIATPADAAAGMFGQQAQSSPLFGTPTSAPALSGSLSYMGATIVNSNHLPTAEVTSGDANYQVDARGVKAIMWQRASVASIKKMGLKVDTVEDVRRNTNFTVASMYSGAGVLRPELVSVVVDAGVGGGSATVGDLVGSGRSTQLPSLA